jgi:hypothetical protein
VSQKLKLAEGLFVTSQVDTFAKRGATAAFGTLQQAAYLTRTWGDCYGYFLVATGRAELMVDPILNVWDAAAVQPIVEEAGGTFTDWQGNPTIHAGEAIATNGRVLKEVLAIVQKFPPPESKLPAVWPQETTPGENLAASARRMDSIARIHVSEVLTSGWRSCWPCHLRA